MTETEIAEMVGDLYWSGLARGDVLLSDEAAVSMLAECAGVSRGRACTLLLQTGPSARARRQFLRRDDGGGGRNG